MTREEFIDYIEKVGFVYMTRDSVQRLYVLGNMDIELCFNDSFNFFDTYTWTLNCNLNDIFKLLKNTKAYRSYKLKKILR